jgi:hypothetical protein
LRAAPEDKALSDDEWAAIAHDVMNRTGLARYGEEDDVSCPAFPGQGICG